MRGAWQRAGGFAMAAVLGLGCGGANREVTSSPGGSGDPKRWPADDRSLCEQFVHWRHNPELEASETAGPGSIRPNIRRVFKSVGERDNRHTVLLCREIDSNLDGIKDLVRTFTEKGEPLHEEGDTNFDGKIDVWLNFADGRIQEEDEDTTFTMGRPNVWKFYVDGQLTRVRRNTHCPGGRADTWEIYYKDRLERVGNDNTCDGHVDRWDRDAQLLAADDRQATADADGGSPTAPSTTDTPPHTEDAADAGAAKSAGDAGKKK